MADGRKNNGGWRPNSGRKSKAAELGLPYLIDSCIPEEKRGRIIDNLFRLAIGKNPKAAVSAASLLLAYMYGKPTEHIEAVITRRDFAVEIGGMAHESEGEGEFVN